MPTNTLALTPHPWWQPLDDEGNILPGAKLYTYLAGTDTPSPVYTDHLGLVPHTNPVIFDAYGRATIYLGIAAYKFKLYDANDVLIRTQDQVQDIGLTFFRQLGRIMATGARDVVSGYEILVSDSFISVDSTGGDDPCVITLPTVVDAAFPVIVKNNGDIAIALTPQSGETIDGVAGPYTIPPATATLRPSVMLITTGNNSNWDIAASHGITE